MIEEVTTKSQIQDIRAQIEALDSNIRTLKSSVVESKKAITCTSDIELLWEKDAMIARLRKHSDPLHVPQPHIAGFGICNKSILQV